MEIIYEDNNIICLNKKPGIPTQPDKTGSLSLFDNIKSYIKSEVFIINRLDRPVGGVILFAKNKNAAKLYSEALNSNNTEKTYYAIVNNKPLLKEDKIVNYLYKKSNKAYIGKNNSNSKRAELYYNYIGSGERYHFLKINLSTGRFHQIRAQLSNIGCKIKGDVKYGFRRSNKDRSICLHAYKLSFTDPINKTNKKIIADFPDNILWKELSKYI